MRGQEHPKEQASEGPRKVCLIFLKVNWHRTVACVDKRERRGGVVHHQTGLVVGCRFHSPKNEKGGSTRNMAVPTAPEVMAGSSVSRGARWVSPAASLRCGFGCLGFGPNPSRPGRRGFTEMTPGSPHVSLNRGHNSTRRPEWRKNEICGGRKQRNPGRSNGGPVQRRGGTVHRRDTTHTQPTTLRNHFGSSRDRLLGSRLGSFVSVDRVRVHLCTGPCWKRVNLFDLCSGMIIACRAQFEGFWVWRSGAVGSDLCPDACDACRLAWCCDLNGPLPPVVFSVLVLVLGEGGLAVWGSVRSR